MTSAARDLMDTGTAAPWTTSDFMPPWEHEGVTFPELVDIEPQVCSGVPIADARKIVLSVNALPLVDALIEAADRRHYGCTVCGYERPCVYIRARDALEAALRGEGDG